MGMSIWKSTDIPLAEKHATELALCSFILHGDLQFAEVLWNPFIVSHVLFKDGHVKSFVVFFFFFNWNA